MSNGNNPTGTNYTVIFQNNSTVPGSAAIYQQQPNLNNPDVLSLAWFAEGAAPTTQVIFQWQITYDFVWSQSGMLAPGVVFTASQTWPANLTSTNAVTFTDAGNLYTFTMQQAGPQAGSLYITEDNTIPPDQAAVGIGMSGFGTFAVQAEPNTNLIFTPTPTYWIVFGNFIQGQVLDITEIIGQSAQIVFPPNVYSMTATLNASNEWTIEPTANTNAQFLAAKKKNPKAQWGVPSKK